MSSVVTTPLLSSSVKRRQYLQFTGMLLRRASATRMFSTMPPIVEAAQTSSTTSSHQLLTHETWQDDALRHRETLTEMLYPPGENMKLRQHLVHSHPIYNFLHRYYRYSVEELYRYSPGYDTPMQVTEDLYEAIRRRERQGGGEIKQAKKLVSSSIDLLSEKFLVALPENRVVYSKKAFQDTLASDGKYGWVNVVQSYEILRKSSKRTAFLGCYGMHEWAMLYSGSKKSQEQSSRKRHQEALGLRVSQKVIDEVVESSGIRCTHFDAWRFFHPDAQPMNIYNPMSRSNQENHEQPGCIHANMDLFKYAFQLYPLVSSDLLRRCLALALKARNIDMRASPYDVSMYSGCEDTLAVETVDGKKKYVQEQEALAKEALPLRLELLNIYKELLNISR